MKLLLGVIAIIIVVGIAGYLIFTHRSWEIVNYPSMGKNIIAFGDSLVEGVGAAPGNGFISVLSKKIGRPIINAGVSGDTTFDGLNRLKESVLDKEPKVVIILLGGNDYLLRLPKEQTFANLSTLIDRIQEKGAVVILLGVRGGLIKDNYDRNYKKLAKEKGAAYVPNVLKGLLSNPKLMSDSIHPNDEGYRLIAERVFPVLQSVLD